MADRRMFSKIIIDSDDFLNMPLSTQCLYFHLAMRADDEGFLNNPKKIQRMIGATDDDFRVLFSKQYVIPFESGIVVIRHWKIHNYIRSDRFKNTIYQDEAEQLATDKSGAYILADIDGDTKKDTPPQSDNTVTTNCLPSDYQMATNCLPSDYQMATTCPSSGSIGKVRIDKDRIGKDKSRAGWRDSVDHLSDLFGLSDEVKVAFVKYLTYLEEDGRKVSPISAESVLKKLETLSDSDADSVTIFEQSIRNGWKDLYVLKKPEKTGHKNAVGSFGNYEQRNFDYREVEKKMRGYESQEDDDAIHRQIS